MATTDLSEEKQRARAVWAAGDYPSIVHLIASAGEAAVDRAELSGSEKVLDIACGSGNATFPAARAGAKVTGLDLTPELLEAGRKRSAEEGVEIEWVEGDAEDLPFDDGSFDVVLSVFGVMFAPDQRRAAQQAARVLGPGGRMVLCNWTMDGKVGEFFGILAKHMPPPPEGFQPPVLWGTEEHVRTLFEGTGVELSFEPAQVSFEMDSVDDAVELYTTRFGPVVTAKATLEPEGKWEAALADIHDYFKRFADRDGRVNYHAEYLIVKGTKSA